VIKHRYFYITVAVLLLAAIIVTAAVVSAKNPQAMETYSSRSYSANKDAFSMWGAAGGEAEEHVWYLRDFGTPYIGGSDRDRVYLRMAGEGIHTILIKTNRDVEKKNNAISFTVLEFDMVRIMLGEKYNDNNTDNDMQTSRVVFNGRRRVLMEYLPENLEGERVRFTLFKYIAKNNTWLIRNSVILTSYKVKLLMDVHRKIQAKLESYEYRIEPSMSLSRDHNDNNDDDDDDADYDAISVDSDNDEVRPPKSRRLDYVTQPMDSTEHPTASASLDEAMGVDEH
jgi:hypothetical protein